MESTVCHISPSFLTTPTIKNPSKVSCLQLKNRGFCQKGGVILRHGHKLTVECCKGDSKNDELKLEEELIGLAKLREKCKEKVGGVVELLECLEREAIMGDDEGREPHDYNRRAQIFDKSSQVFQALKEESSSTVS